MNRKVLASLLAVMMLFSVLPLQVMAKLDAGHSIEINYQILYVSDDFYIGYNLGAKENTTFTCQYNSCNDDAFVSHSLLISDIKAAADRANPNVGDYEGYTITGWTKNTSANPSVNKFPAWLSARDTTSATRGCTIYLVAEKPAVRTTYTLKFDANGGSGAPSDLTYTGTETSHTFTIPSTRPVGSDEVDCFKGWAETADGAAAYQPNGAVTVTKDQPSKTLYAVWGLHGDSNGDGFCDDCRKCMHDHDENGYCKEDNCQHTGDCCANKAPVLADSDVPALIGKVTVACDTVGDHKKEYDVIANSWQVNDVDTLHKTVTVSASLYVEAFQTEFSDPAHTYSGAESVDVSLEYADGKWNVTGGTPVIFRVECEETTDPSQPHKPTHEELVRDLPDLVEVKCSTKFPPVHTSIYFDLIEGTYTVSELFHAYSGDTFVTITITDAQAYVDAFNRNQTTTHTYLNHTSFARIVWDEQNQKWAKINGFFPNHDETSDLWVNTKCDWQPDAPTALPATVRCTGDGDHGSANPFTMDVLDCIADGTVPTASWNENTWRSEYSLVIDPEKVAAKFNGLYKTAYGEHTPAAYEMIPVTLQYKYSYSTGTSEWVLLSPTNLEIELKCHKVYINYTAGLSSPVSNMPDSATVIVGMGYTIPNQIPTSEGWKFTGWTYEAPGDNGWVTKTITVADIVSGVTLYPVEDIRFNAAWEEAKDADVHVVIYNKKDLTKPVVNVKYETTLEAGETLILGDIDYKSYYSSPYGFECMGWYNDGGFNAYKNGDITQTIAELEITGAWQNIILVVEDYYPVQFFLTEEDMNAYAYDHTKTYLVYAKINMLEGTILPSSEAPDVEDLREGYEFLYWSREGQTANVAGSSVTGWTNLYGVWKQMEHQVCFNTNGGTPETIDSQWVKHGECAIRPANPTREGYTFRGWEVETGVGPTSLDWEAPNAFDFTTPITDFLQLKAIWEKDAPTEDDIKKALSSLEKDVTVGCVTVPRHPQDLVSAIIGLPENYEIAPTETYCGYPAWTVELSSSQFVAEYNKRWGAHTLCAGEPETLTWLVYWNDEEWCSDPVDEKLWVEHSDNYSYTVNYVEEGTGKVLAPAKTVSGNKYGAAVTENAISIEGYVPTTEQASLTIGERDNTITFTYTARTDITYTVRYMQYLVNAEIAPAKVVTGQTFGATVTETAIDILYYVPFGDTTATITLGASGNEIIFYYTYYNPYPPIIIPPRPTLNTADHYAYVMGYPDGTVRPEDNITRAEVATIFFRLLTDDSRAKYWTTENAFSDVNAGDWHNNAISTLANAGIVNGYEDGTFRPDAPITRGEMAKIVAQFATLDKTSELFSDVSGHWSEAYINLAAGNGWINGYPDGSFKPEQSITRAETMTMINRVLNRVPENVSRLLPVDQMVTFPDCTPDAWYYINVQEATNSHTYEREKNEKDGDENWIGRRDNKDWTQLEN